MLMPRLISGNLFDDWMGDFPTGKDFFSNHDADIMKTDVKESDKGFEMKIDLPGFKKEDVKATLEDGYLTINASRSASNDEKDEDGKYIRKERYEGNCSRSFYVGENLTDEDIHAKFEAGTLKIDIPKKQAPEIEKQKFIAIEG